MTRHAGSSCRLGKGKSLLPYMLCLRSRSRVLLGSVLGFLLLGLFLRSLGFYRFVEIDDGIVL